MKHVNVSLFVPHLGCPHRCVFCDQRAISGSASPVTAQEIDKACRIAANSPHDVNNSEIAFFGGSFTAVDREVQETCLNAAAPYVGTSFAGVRVSTRPDAVDEETLAFLKRHGVTAVELGAQSMDDAVLQKNERGHTSADTVRAAGLIKNAGFRLGLQMMTGMYGSTDRTDLSTANALLALAPDTVRVYPTVVLRGTRLEELYRAGEYTPPELEDSVFLCARILRLFTAAGVPVIRLGLHAETGMQERLVAGPYHPAFRELCETQLYRQALETLLLPLPPGAYTVSVAPGHASKAAGHKRANALYFAGLGYRLKFKQTDTADVYRPQIQDISEE